MLQQTLTLVRGGGRGTGGSRDCARGGLEIDLSWQAGRLLSAEVRSDAAHGCQVRYGERVAELQVKAGEAARLNGNLARVAD